MYDASVKNRNLVHSGDWATPPNFYGKLDAEFHFDYDPCPLGGTEAFTKPWGKVNYINPPYSRKLKEAFVDRAIEVAGGGATCVMLLPVSTSTALFHEKILPNAKEIRFVRGRVRFMGTNTKGEYVTDRAPMHDSMIVVFKG